MSNITKTEIRKGSIGNKKGWRFGYPENWRTNLESHFKIFVEDLYFSNQRAWNNTYNDKTELKPLKFASIKPYNDELEVYFVLRGLRYNLCTNSGKTIVEGKSEKRLDNLINSIANHLIDRLPNAQEVSSKYW